MDVSWAASLNFSMTSGGFVIFTLGHGLSKSGIIYRLVPVHSDMGSYLEFFMLQ